MTQPLIFMTARDISAAFSAAYNSGRVENLLALYDPSARVVQASQTTATALADGEALATGPEAVRTELARLLQLGGQMESTAQYAIEAGDVALVGAAWTLRTHDSNGEPLVLTGCSAEIVRRQPDGTWRYLVDHPFGGGRS